MPRRRSSSPNSVTSSARTPGPATTQRHGVARVDHVGRRRRRVVAGHADDRAVDGQLGEDLVELLDRRAASPRDPLCARRRRSSSGARRRTSRRASSRARTCSSRRRRSSTGSSVSGSTTGSRPTYAPSPRRKARLADERPPTPCRSRNVGTSGGRPHHLSVITLNCSPSSRRITSRVHSSAARAVRSASGTSA